MTLSSTMTKEGQVTIPAEIRARLGLSEGDVVVFKEEADGRVVVQTGRDVVARSSGVFRRYAEDTPLTPEEWREAAEVAIGVAAGE